MTTAGAAQRNRRRGFDAERRLVELLESKGWRAFRVPASGAGGRLPDVFAVNNQRQELAAFEVKVTESRHVRVGALQLARLQLFVSAFKLYPIRSAVVAVHFPERGWVFRLAPPTFSDLVVRDSDRSEWEP